MRALGKLVYWIAVLAISLVLVVLLILWFESRDDSQLESDRGTPSAEKSGRAPEGAATASRFRTR